MSISDRFIWHLEQALGNTSGWSCHSNAGNRLC